MAITPLRANRKIYWASARGLAALNTRLGQAQYQRETGAPYQPTQPATLTNLIHNQVRPRSDFTNIAAGGAPTTTGNSGIITGPDGGQYKAGYDPSKSKFDEYGRPVSLYYPSGEGLSYDYSGPPTQPTTQYSHGSIESNAANPYQTT